VFFVSVASKGVRFSVSLLFATLAGRFISVASKGLGDARCLKKVTGGDGRILEEFEGLLGGQT
jgi:hypothetical protein